MPSTATNLRLGVIAGYAVAGLSVCYAVVLAIGLWTLPSPDQPIQNPWFTAMEWLILGIAPAMVALSVGLHAWAPLESKAHAQLSVVFMAMAAVTTCGVHFAILTLSREPAFAGEDWAALVFAFRWPSLAYALDILAWDVFFPLAAFFAALSVKGPGIQRLARNLLFASAALAFIGLAGVPLADMDVRNIGIIGYLLLYPMAAILLSIILRRETLHGHA